jgi:hypothetical protein
MVGIDKLILTTRDFRVESASSKIWGKDCHTKQGGKGPSMLLTTKEGEDVYATKIYHNADLLNATVNHLGLNIQFNPSKWHHQYHLSGLGPKFNGVVEEVQTYLHKTVGVECSFKDMQINRIDLADQHEMKLEPNSYHDAIKLFKHPRIKNTKEHPTGYTIGNMQWQTCAYDKLQELKDYKLDSFIEGEKNLLRIENRWMKTKEVNKTLPFNTINKLYSIDNEELHFNYKQFLRTKTLNKHYNSEQIKIDFAEQGEILRDYLSVNSTYAAICHFIMQMDSTDIDLVFLQFGGQKKFRKFLEEEGGIGRSQSYNYTNTLMQFLKHKMKFVKDNGKVSVTQMYEEILNKFVA